MSNTKRIAKYIKQEKKVHENNCIELLNEIEKLETDIKILEKDIDTYSYFRQEQDLEVLENCIKDRLIYERTLQLKKLEIELEISKLANKNANLNWIDDNDSELD